VTRDEVKLLERPRLEARRLKGVADLYNLPMESTINQLTLQSTQYSGTHRFSLPIYIIGKISVETRTAVDEMIFVRSQH
jgi:hypothetical protein